MSKVLCESQDLTNIADAIREKTNTTDTMAVSSMAYNINSISNNGISDEYIAQIEQNTSNINQLQQEIVNLETETKAYTDNKITDLKAQGVQQAPLLAEGENVDEAIEWLEANGDTTKVYVLPNGNIAGRKKVTIAGGKAYTNLAEPLPNNTTDTTKWVNGYRISSSSFSAQSGKTICNPISVVAGDVISVEGVTIGSEDRYLLEYTNASGVRGGNRAYVSSLPDVEISGYEYIDGIYKFTIAETEKLLKSTNMILRLTFTTPTDPSQVIITRNEEIKETEPYEGYAWADLGISIVEKNHDNEILELNQDVDEINGNIIDLKETTQSLEETTQSLEESIEALENDISKIGTTEIPSYWEDYLNSKIATIKGYHKQFGKDCFSFIEFADPHYASNLGKVSPLLAKKIADECDIKHILEVGDSQTRGCHQTKDLLLAENEAIEEFYKPIKEKLRRQKGNHDGAYGWLDRDGDGTYNNTGKEPHQRESYVHNLTQEEFHEYMYRKVGMVENVHFDDTGTAYYIDDISNNVRYIGLNTQYNKYELQADGTQKYPTMWIMRFAQSQFDFLINEALVENTKDKTRFVIFAHVPLTQEIGDREIMQGVLNAFKNKTTYSGSYGGSYGWDSVSVNVDFSNAKGKLVGYFHGHTHVDSLHTSYGFNIIGTRCDGHEENDATLKAEKVKGTTTEQSFDVFTVTSDKIYVTKIGAGSDRVISY